MAVKKVTFVQGFFLGKTCRRYPGEFKADKPRNCMWLIYLIFPPPWCSEQCFSLMTTLPSRSGWSRVICRKAASRFFIRDGQKPNYNPNIETNQISSLVCKLQLAAWFENSQGMALVFGLLSLAQMERAQKAFKDLNSLRLCCHSDMSQKRTQKATCELLYGGGSRVCKNHLNGKHSLKMDFASHAESQTVNWFDNWIQVH